MKKNILVTGGAGFIGSFFAKKLVSLGHKVSVVDKLTYASNLENLATVKGQYSFYQEDIQSADKIFLILKKERIDWVVHFAAESHVDNSIESPAAFIETNINGTFSLLRASQHYFDGLGEKQTFKFLHVSTDEVFGALNLGDDLFDETSPYRPNSPYSASKAASDHLVRSWWKTYGLPCITTNCSNNFGENQHPEKLIPKVIQCCLEGKPIPVYGEGKQIRDWISVNDHCEGILLALEKGRLGETYCFGGEFEIQNIDLVKMICQLVDEIYPSEGCVPYESLISFVEDRKGHDFRYAISNEKAKKELGFRVEGNFREKLKETIRAYCMHYRKIEKNQPLVVHY